jgi:hypothetical protein
MKGFEELFPCLCEAVRELVPPRLDSLILYRGAKGICLSEEEVGFDLPT